MESKRGQELSTNAIVLIVIGIIVLVVLILGFTIGWDKLLPFFSTNNVQNLQTTCSSACATGNSYDYCTLPRTLKASDIPGGLKEFTANCTYFANNPDYAKYGIATCTSLSAPCSYP